MQADGSVVPVCIGEWTEETLEQVLHATQVKRCWSHSLIAFGADCGVALMGYADAKASGDLTENVLAGKLMGTMVQGDFLLVYWDSHKMCCGGLEPQEVDRVLEELERFCSK